MTLASIALDELKKIPEEERPKDAREVAIELLIGLGEEAWQHFPGRDEVRARRDHVKTFLKEDLTWILLERVEPQALLTGVQWIIHQAQLRRNKKISQLQRELHGAPAPAHPKETAGGGEDESAIQYPSTSHAAPTAPLLPPDRIAERIAARVRVETRLCRLDTVLVYGKPIGNCTVAEARAWATERQQDAREASRDARFAFALISNLDSGQVIRDHWADPVEVDVLYERAQAEHATR